MDWLHLLMHQTIRQMGSGVV